MEATDKPSCAKDGKCKKRTCWVCFYRDWPKDPAHEKAVQAVQTGLTKE